MGRRVAVTYYPEGAGHATRMLAIAQSLEVAGVEVALAGGGPGSRFVELNGYEEYRPTAVDYIGDYQRGSLLDVVSRSVPNSGRRVVELVRWLRREEPDALLTDDMFAAIAGPFVDLPLYIVTHNAASFYDAAIQQGFTWLLNRYQLRVADLFLYPAVWPRDAGDPPGVTHVPPIALEGPAADAAEGTAARDGHRGDGANGASSEPRFDGSDPEDGGVLVVPSTYSTNFDHLADALAEEGHDVTLVGDSEWRDVPALLPYVRAADVVVCSGYSTVMEAAVAGTPCVIYPFTDEQHGVSRVIERNGVRGFQVEHSIPHVARAVRRPPEAPEHENGVGTVAERVVEHMGRNL